VPEFGDLTCRLEQAYPGDVAVEDGACDCGTADTGSQCRRERTERIVVFEDIHLFVVHVDPSTTGIEADQNASIRVRITVVDGIKSVQGHPIDNRDLDFRERRSRIRGPKSHMDIGEAGAHRRSRGSQARRT
jgi:hypothetical protein